MECGENGECVRTEEGDICECSEGYRYNGELCETIPTTATREYFWEERYNVRCNVLNMPSVISLQ